jgi:hypothetical protein
MGIDVDRWESMSIDRWMRVDRWGLDRSIDRVDVDVGMSERRNVGPMGKKRQKRKTDKPTNGAIGGPSLNPREGRCVTLDGS